MSDTFDEGDYQDQRDEADIREAAADPQWAATTKPQRPMGQRVESLADAQPGDVVHFQASGEFETIQVLVKSSVVCDECGIIGAGIDEGRANELVASHLAKHARRQQSGDST